jgi:hypothetical protein
MDQMIQSWELFSTFKMKSKTKLMMSVKAILGITLFLIVLSCNSNKSPQQTISINEKEVQSANQLQVMQETYYRFPSPDEMLNFINKENLNFNDHILLPVENAPRYLDSKSQALNLGIYISDMAYIILFKRQKEALSYFQVVYDLSDKLRMSSAFDPGLLKRFEDNLKNVDSLKSLSDGAMIKITNYLVQNDKEKTLAVISIGGYIESLYLAFSMVNNYSENNPIIQRISDQKLVLENLLNYSLVYTGDQNVSDAIKILQPIRSCYNSLTTTSSETTVTKDKNGKLIISGGQKISITEEQYNKLRDATFAARKAITENTEK